MLCCYNYFHWFAYWVVAHLTQKVSRLITIVSLIDGEVKPNIEPTKTLSVPTDPGW